jgi:hypothetical protein
VWQSSSPSSSQSQPRHNFPHSEAISSSRESGTLMAIRFSFRSVVCLRFNASVRGAHSHSVCSSSNVIRFVRHDEIEQRHHSSNRSFDSSNNVVSLFRFSKLKSFSNYFKNEKFSSQIGLSQLLFLCSLARVCPSPHADWLLLPVFVPSVGCGHFNKGDFSVALHTKQNQYYTA